MRVAVPSARPHRRGGRLRGSRRGRGLIAAAAMSAVLLAGCSLPVIGDDPGPDPVPPTSVGTPAPPDDPADRPELAAYYGQKITWRDCEDGFECSSVRVPVDWAAPAGATLDLGVIRRKAAGQRIGSMLVNPGGPGVAAVDWLRAAVSGYGPALRNAFDIVAWDPRGVGTSSQVRCLSNDEIDAYLEVDGSPDDAAERAAFVREQQEFAAGCRARTGALLDHMDTVSTVKDLDVLRAVLGDTTLSYFGASYGTFIGAWYAETFPWRVGRLVLDGGVDPSLDAKAYGDGQVLGFARAIQAYLTDCLTQQGCPFRGTVDDAKEQLQQLVDRADAQPLPTSSDRVLTQTKMQVGIIQGMYLEGLWPQVSEAITQAMQGDGTSLLALADLYFDRDKNGQYGAVLQSNAPTYCIDHPETRTVDQIATDAQTTGGRYPLLGAMMTWSAVGCVGWPVKPVVTPQRLTAEGAAPIVVVGTTGDPATPYEWSEALAAQLSSGRLITREGFGHTGYGESDCVTSAVEAYLVSGALPAENLTCS